MSNVTHMRNMLGNTSLERLLREHFNVGSFFEGIYCDMPIEQRRRKFAKAFAWRRRLSFLLFLARCGYLPCSGDMSYTNTVMSLGDDTDTDEAVSCDALFNVEDMYRYICKFL